MLSNNVPATPRPRPPAKARRSTSMQLPPPPPYQPRLDTLDDTGSDTLDQLATTQTKSSSGSSPLTVDEWMHDQSRRELSSLLLRADELIKTRETELGLTSALCKTLYNDNVTLKTKHEALIARLPTSDLQSPLPVPSSLSPCPSPQNYVRSLPQSPNESPDFPSHPIPLLRHTRKISVTPAEIAQLADQNAELLHKLEKLEEESEQADQVGKRKLRKLEKEIQGLRDELDRTRVKSEEIEEKAKAVLSITEGEVQRKKKAEREERARALREKGIAASQSLSDLEVRDFAPLPELSRSGSLRSKAAPVPNFATKPNIPLVLAPEGMAEEPQTTAEVGAETIAETPRAEYALISQLFAKIQELEDTNTQITREQREASSRLMSAQRDVASLKKAYECLVDDDGELCVVEPSDAVRSEDTVLFSSLRRKIDRKATHVEEDPDADFFASGISGEMQSTSRSVLAPQADRLQVPPAHKARKSVVGLFDAPKAPTELELPKQPEYPETLTMTPTFRNATPYSTPPEDHSMWSVAATEGLNASSPTLTTLGLSRKPAPMHTLGSELGSDYGDDSWQETAGHRARQHSLYDLINVANSRPTTPSPDISPPEELRSSVPLPTADSPSDWEDVDEAVAAEVQPVPESAGLQLVLQPPTPAKSVEGLSSVREARSLRNRRLSQTMRARTNRWVEGRFGEPSTTPSRPRRRKSMKSLTNGSGHASRPSDASMIFTETFSSVVRQVSIGGGIDELEEEDEVMSKQLVRRSQHQRSDSTVSNPGARKQGFVGFILEVWLWLQFAIVVCVFLWAMARRGPKSILQEAERRQTGSKR